MTEHGWSVSDFIRESGISRTTVYEWLDENSNRPPTVVLVQRYAQRLGVPYEPYAEALGWTEAAAAPPKDPEGFIKRAREMAEHEDTPEEERIILLARIEAAEMHLKNARDSERRFEELMRGVFEDEKDAPGH